MGVHEIEVGIANATGWNRRDRDADGRARLLRFGGLGWNYGREAARFAGGRPKRDDGGVRRPVARIRAIAATAGISGGRAPENAEWLPWLGWQ